MIPKQYALRRKVLTAQRSPTISISMPSGTSYASLKMPDGNYITGTGELKVPKGTVLELQVIISTGNIGSNPPSASTKALCKITIDGVDYGLGSKYYRTVNYTVNSDCTITGIESSKKESVSGGIKTFYYGVITVTTR